MTNVKHIREICKLAESFGLTVEKVEKGKHFKVYLDTPAGKKILTVSVTSSDGRSVKNNTSLLRAWSK